MNYLTNLTTHLEGLPKSPTGIMGFDQITLGGLPTGRPTLICGAAGSGKTLFACAFLVNGATQFGETGVFMSFEERAADLVANFASLGYDLDGLISSKKLAIDHVVVQRGEIEETGEYDLEGLFLRLGFAVDAVGAKRVVLDTIESLFSGFKDQSVLRAELRRLFGWIKDRGLTAIITGERGESQLTRLGLEEYVSDCVIVLDNRIEDQTATRRLRVVKYRGSSHGTNEYPFLIDENGISVMPLTSAGLVRPVSDKIIPTGISGLDAMLQNGGFYRGSSILVSGVAGTGKTTIGSHFIDAACARGERCMLFAFEEGAKELCRNALSVGIDLQAKVDAGLLRFEEARPSLYGLEMHLTRIHRDLMQFKPEVVVIDPISAFRGPTTEVHSTLLRMLDIFKSQGITGMFTSLRSDNSLREGTDQGLYSLMDSWIRLSHVEECGERNRTLYVIKSRGTNHSNQIREYLMTDTGIKLIDPYIGTKGVLTGTARIIQTALEDAAEKRQTLENERLQRSSSRRLSILQRQIRELEADLVIEREEAQTLLNGDNARDAAQICSRAVVASRRGAVE